VVTSQDDGTADRDDESLLSRATELGRVLVSQDEDLLRIAHEKQDTGVAFSGVIFAHQLRIGVGEFVRDLQLLAECSEPADVENQVTYLPLT
jgi:hypothetical protein